MTCTASGSNIHRVTWYKDGWPLDEEYFHISGLKSIPGSFKCGQETAVRSIVRRKWKVCLSLFIIHSSQNTVRIKWVAYRIMLSAMKGAIPFNDIIKSQDPSKIINDTVHG